MYFFCTSGIRCAELETTGKLLSPPEEIHHWPQFKEVRMIEFTLQILLRACLAYWENLVDAGEDAQERCKAKSFLYNWLNKEIAPSVVIRDIAEVITRLQLKFQNNQLTFPNVKKLLSFIYHKCRHHQKLVGGKSFTHSFKSPLIQHKSRYSR